MSLHNGLHLNELDRRSRLIFQEIVESYLKTGEPVGSKSLANDQRIDLSSASIRNTMAALSSLGLLRSAHSSAGRTPTESGLRLFVDGLLQFGDLQEDDQLDIDTKLMDRPLQDAMDQASSLLSGMANGAGLVLAPVQEDRLRHVEFVPLSPTEALAVLVLESGAVENRLMAIPPGTPHSALTQAGNFLAMRLKGRSLAEARDETLLEINNQSNDLDQMAKQLIKAGLAQWSDASKDNRTLIVKGRSRLIEDIETRENLERIQVLLDDLEKKKELISLLDEAGKAPGVKIYIGSENSLFSLSGSSVITAPYMNAQGMVLGAIGVIGPTRLNYARVIPMVDYTAQALGFLLRKQQRKDTDKKNDER